MIRHLAFCLLASCLFPCSARASHQAPPELSGLLMDAVRAGDEGKVRSLLAQGARANTRKQPSDATALEAALGRGLNPSEYKFNKRIVNQLIAEGDALESIFPGDYQALSEAVQRGDRYLLKILVDRMWLREDFNYITQLDTWRIMTIATLKEDVSMLKAIGECLPSEDVWIGLGGQENAVLHPFEIAIRFEKRKAFDCFLAPPLLSGEMLQELRSDGRSNLTFTFNASIVGALIAVVESGSATHLEAMLNVHPKLLQDACRSSNFLFDDRRNDFLTNIIIVFESNLLKRLWAEHLSIPDLVGRGELNDDNWENYILNQEVKPKGTWKSLAKLHVMGSRPRSEGLTRFVACFQKGELSAKEFEELLRPLGSWPMEPAYSELFEKLDWVPLRCDRAFEDPEILRIMLRAGIPIKTWRDAKGRSLLHHAAQQSIEWTVFPKNYLAPLVQEAGLDINALDTSGQPAVAYVRPLSDFIRFVEGGARVEWPECPEGHALNRWIVNYRGWSTESNFMPAYADSDWLKSNTFRLKMKPLLNMAAGGDRRTPLTTACEILQQYPLRHGECGTDRFGDRLRETPEAKKRREEKERRAAQEEERAWQSRRDPLIALLLDAGADANQADGRGWTPARAAVESNDLVRLRTLISHPKGLRCVDQEGLLNALVRGPGHSRKALLALLKKHGVDC